MDGGAIEHPPRFIPACAGNTAASTARPAGNGSSPPVRGTLRQIPRMWSWIRGSSPPVRGTRRPHPRLCAPTVATRFIPACAGNTFKRASLFDVSPVHPRLCGEHELPVGHILRWNGSSPPVRGTQPLKPRQAVPIPGSSPPVRGTLRLFQAAVDCRRFIPTCAGNTVCPTCTLPSQSVHPRLCGEHMTRLGKPERDAGSSPPVRGTRATPDPKRHGGRFIPACAGNTATRGNAWPPIPVHPRLCGEHFAFGARTADEDGSSPPVRGTRCAFARARCLVRFIPACAGNTRFWSSPSCGKTVHPRLCGEHCLPVGPPSVDRGSSPPVRGTLARRRVRRDTHRFIPACAGNTWLLVVVIGNAPVHPRLCGEHSNTTPFS